MEVAVASPLIHGFDHVPFSQFTAGHGRVQRHCKGSIVLYVGTTMCVLQCWEVPRF